MKKHGNRHAFLFFRASCFEARICLSDFAKCFLLSVKQLHPILLRSILISITLVVESVCMKIVEFGSASEKKRYPISEDDRLWVEENFRWLKEVFGYPNQAEEQVLIGPKHFPKTFSQARVSVTNVVDDLCVLFGISKHSVTVEILTDLRDYNIVPYQVAGQSFECEADLTKGRYKVFVASSLQQHPDRLIYSLIYEFIRIRLTESDLEYDVGGDDTGLFIYLAGIYYGLGILLANNLVPQGRADGFSEIKWNYGSEMPLPVMAFSLATYANLTGHDNPSWRKELKPEVEKLFGDAVIYLKEYPNDLYDANEVKANEFFNQANDYFENNQFEEAIQTLQKILFITNDDLMRADVHNNIGYYYLRVSDFRQAISHFRKALALGPEYGFANDNLGYSLIMIGELEEGMTYIEKAQATGNNDMAYTYRNRALYHQRKLEFELAESFFVKAFEEGTPVDLLDFHYAKLLLEQGKADKAKIFLEKSAAKGEKEGIELLNSLKIL